MIEIITVFPTEYNLNNMMYGAKNAPRSSFDELKSLYPECIRFVEESASPLWGITWFIRGTDNYPEFWKSNTDTSD